MTDIAIKELRDLCLKALTKTGLSAEHATITVDHYLENEISGKASHGMVRVVGAVASIKQYGVPEQAPQIIIDKDNMAVIDGHKNLGPVIGKKLVDESIKRAKKHGLSFVGAHNYIVNTGSMAYYLRLLANQNLIGLISCNSVPLVSSPDGKDKIVGTNPIGLGVPSSDGNHFIADFATSAIAYGKVMVAMDKNESLPENCMIDKDGNPSTNPKELKDDGAILPLADYRGFSLALFVELLAASFGAQVMNKKDNFAQNDWHGKDGFFIIAIDPSPLANSSYPHHISEILNYIRQSAPAPGHESVSIPGDRSAATLKENLTKGVINVTDKTLEKIKEMAA